VKFFFVYILSLFFIYSFIPWDGNAQSGEPSEVDKDTLKKEIIISLGIGVSTYDKEEFLFCGDLLILISKKFYAGLVMDYYKFTKSGREPRKFSSLSINALYRGDFGTDKFNFFIGGGLLISMGRGGGGGPGGLNGYARVDYNITNKFGVGIAYKQPLFVGIDFSAPPLMLFDVSFNYRISE
jgi:hypothetical protein